MAPFGIGVTVVEPGGFRTDLRGRVGACTSALQPLHALIEAHVLAAERLHGDDTHVPILAKGKAIKGHVWTWLTTRRVGVIERRLFKVAPSMIQSLPSGGELLTLRDAGDFIAKLPKRKHDAPERQAAIRALMPVVEHDSQTLLARIGMMRALHSA